LNGCGNEGKERLMSVKDKFKTASPLFGRKSISSSAEAAISSPSGFKHASHVGSDLSWSGCGGSVEAFDFQRLLGTGAFGEVWLAKHTATQQVFAMKELPVLDLKAVEQEVDILKRCRHDNIVSYYGTVSEPQRERIYILMEYCEMGVRDLIEKVKKACAG
jgi:serine/threonine protein kinase